MSVRGSVVLSRFVNLRQRSAYVLDRFADEGEPLGRNERIILPDLGAMTIYRDASVPRQAGARNTPHTLVGELELIVDQEPWIPMQMRNTDSTFNLSGNWDQQVADQAFVQLANLLDTIVVDEYIVGELCWLPGGAQDYHFNTDADGLQPKDVLVARGIALRQTGTFNVNLMLVFDTLAVSAVMGWPGWKEASSNSSFGADTVGKIYGIVVVETQSVRCSKQFEIATAAVAGQVLTLTFTSNPGFVVGDPIRTTGLQANYNHGVATPIDTVSADGLTITSSMPQSDDADVNAAGDGICISAAAHNICVDKSMIHQAKTKVPYMRTVADPDTSGNVVQIVSLLGFVGRLGRAFSIKSPEASID